MNRASRTAELAALARASQARELGALRGPDTTVECFLGPALRLVVATEPVRRLVLAVMARRMPGSYGWVLSRSRLIDATVERELREGATQLVVLGAGYDTRVHRFRHLIDGRGRAFEVDAAPTSERKQAKVRSVFGALPKHVSYVKVDFDRQTMEEPLLAAGYDPTARTVFTWEGVTFYLSADAIDRTFAFVTTKSARRSTIVFDYIFRSVLTEASDLFGAKETIRAVRRRGEPFTFGLEPSAVDEFLSARGLTLEENALPGDLQRRYLAGIRDATYRVGGFCGIATARV